jgi:hypothetical protein
MTTQANSPANYSELHKAVSAIASVCDGAASKDYQGFNGHDTLFGKRAADTPLDQWTPAIAQDVYNMLDTYKTQLRGFGIDYKSLPDPGIDIAHNQGRQDARQAEYQRNHAPYLVFYSPTYVLVKNSYPIKDDLKRNGFRFDPRHVKSQAWESELNPQTASTILGLGVRLDETQRSMLETVAAKLPDTPLVDKPCNIRTNGMPDKLVFDTPNFEVPLAIIRGIPGRKWVGAERVNYVDPHFGLYELAERFNLTISDDARAMIEAHRAKWEAEDKRNRAAIADSIATETDRTDIALYDYLYKFQRAGVAYSLDHLSGTINADEMGLGKTRQALATAETAKAYPLLVICPASVKFVWLREIEALLPHRTAAVYNGRIKDHEIDAVKAEMTEDILILGYPSIESYLPALPELGGVVCDEGHYIKNPKAGRTQAVMTVFGQARDKAGNRIPGKLRKSGAMRMFLTGTPVLNRPKELVQPLIALGVLSTQPGRTDSVGKFLYTYCDPQGTKGRMNFNGLTPGMGEKLNTWLRQECMVRRTKRMVLTDLPPKIRSEQFIALNDAAQATYVRLEKIAAEAAAESRAQAIVYLNKLRAAIGTSKTDMAVEWITSMMESTDKSLVVFAVHKDVQHSIIKALNEYDAHLAPEDEDSRINVTHILGGQDAHTTEEHKARFQAKESRVIVLSFDGAREGHTLTAASDVFFVEYGWNPGTHSQAEDRCHRIGQTDSVTAWYFSAMGTIDEWSYELIKSKRQVVDSVTDGKLAEDESSSIFLELVDRLTAKHGTSRQW